MGSFWRFITKGSLRHLRHFFFGVNLFWPHKVTTILTYLDVLMFTVGLSSGPICYVAEVESGKLVCLAVLRD